MTEREEVPAGGDISKIRDPKKIGPRRPELPVHMIGRARCGRVADRGSHRFPPNRAPQAHLPHQSGNGAARHIHAFAPQLTPHLANPVDLEVLFQTRLISGRIMASRFVLADARPGSDPHAAWARYVDGAIGSTLQIGSTPWTARDDRP